jgi:hypothetical protein
LPLINNTEIPSVTNGWDFFMPGKNILTPD